MKRLISLLSVLIFIFSALSFNVSALNASYIGEYNSRRFITGTENYQNYYSATLTYNTHDYKYIDTTLEIYNNEDGYYYEVNTITYGYDRVISREIEPFSNTVFCGFAISDFYIGVTLVSHLSPGVSGWYTPEVGEDE